VDRYQYLAVMAGCLVITLPLELVVGARVYRDPRRLLRALVPVVAVFYLWDALAIGRDHWTFNLRYVTGWTLLFGVPFEEVVFFVVVPICALLTYEAVSILCSRRSTRRATRRSTRRSTTGAPVDRNTTDA
jgi:lycopene cyclase domain-containing protein